MPAVRLDVREFFEQYERAGRDLDDGLLTSCFCDEFMSLDPTSVAVVSPRALLAALPRRKALFESIGCDGLELADISQVPLDEAHTLVRTAWKLSAGKESGPANITLLSTFLLRRQNGAWRIALYLNHQDIAKLFGDLGAQT